MYGYWRTDKKIEPGFSAELISCDTKGDLDDLNAWPYDGVDTLLKAFDRTVERIPDKNMLGTLNVDEGEYEWLTWEEAKDQAEHISYGI